MSTSSKKSIPVSVYDRSRLVTDAEEGMDADYHIPTINPEPINLREDIVRGEGYKSREIFLFKRSNKSST